MDFAAYIALFAMGLVLALMGGGGAIMTVPIFVYLLGLSPSMATAHSLFVVGTTALIGSFVYIKRGDINFKVGLYFALPSIVGVNFARAIIVPNIPATIFNFGSFLLTKDLLIMLAFAALMILASTSMIRKSKPNDATKNERNSEFYQITSLAIQGFFVGLVAGLVGAGGGFLIIPALVLVAGLNMRVAVGTSLVIIAAQSLLGFLGDVYRGLPVDWNLLFRVSVVAVAGIIVGSLTSRKFQEQKLKTGFGWFVLAMGTFILIEQIRHFISG